MACARSFSRCGCAHDALGVTFSCGGAQEADPDRRRSGTWQRLIGTQLSLPLCLETPGWIWADANGVAGVCSGGLSGGRVGAGEEGVRESQETRERGVVGRSRSSRSRLGHAELPFSAWLGFAGREAWREASDAVRRTLPLGRKTCGEADRSPGRGEVSKEELRAKGGACGDPTGKSQASGVLHVLHWSRRPSLQYHTAWSSVAAQVPTSFCRFRDSLGRAECRQRIPPLFLLLQHCLRHSSSFAFLHTF